MASYSVIILKMPVMKKKYFFLLFFLFVFNFSFSQIHEEMKAIKLYPNPAKTFFSIDSQDVKIYKIEIYSLIGIKEREIRSHFKYIDINTLPKGIYMVKIYSSKAYVVKKLIKNSSQ